MILWVGLALAGPADLAGEALALELGLDGLAPTQAEVIPAWAAACKAGYKPACTLEAKVPWAERAPARVLEALGASCGPKDPVACLADGLGRGWFAEPPDHDGALVALDAACRAKLERGCVEAARIRLGDGADATALEASCGRGFAPACALAGDARRDAAAPAADVEALYRKACDGGAVAGCTGLAEGVADAAVARGLLERACGAGHAWGCAVLGDLYDQGRLGARDVPKALALYEQACERGLGFGCNAAGALLDLGDGVPLDDAAAADHYARACALDGTDGCYNLGLQIEAGESPPRPLGASGGGALDWFRLGCEGGMAVSCAAAARYEPDPTIARQLRDGACASGAAMACEDLAVAALAADPKAADAPAWLATACQGGRPTACVRLASVQIEGGDAAGARASLEVACAANDADGCAALGLMRDQGDGGPADLPGAVAAWRMACDGGRIDACNDLGANLADGRGVDRAPVEAAALFGKACDAKIAAACGNLGVVLLTGDGVPADPTAALARLDEACTGGHAPSCVRIGVVLAKGSKAPVIKKDKKRAVAAFEAACRLGDGTACGRKR